MSPPFAEETNNLNFVFTFSLKNHKTDALVKNIRTDSKVLGDLVMLLLTHGFRNIAVLQKRIKMSSQLDVATMDWIGLVWMDGNLRVE